MGATLTYGHNHNHNHRYSYSYSYSYSYRRLRLVRVGNGRSAQPAVPCLVCPGPTLPGLALPARPRNVPATSPPLPSRQVLSNGGRPFLRRQST